VKMFKDSVGNSIKVSITTDMFNYSFKPEMERKLQLFSDYGFEYIHWCDDWNNNVIYTQRDIKRYRQLIGTVGLECLDVHGAATSDIRIDAEDESLLESYVRLLENRIKFCNAVGGDAVVIHPPSVDDGGVAASQRLNRSLHVFERVRPLCEDLGVVLAIENCFPGDEEALTFYFEKYPPEFAGYCFDSGHAHVNGNFDRLLKFGERLKALHLHDNKGENDDHQPPFWGTIDWRRVLRWIKDNRYEKPINFEITHKPQFFSGDMHGYLKYSVDAIKKLVNLI